MTTTKQLAQSEDELEQIETDTDEAIEDVSPDDPSESIPFIYDIASYGADPLVDSLVKRLGDGGDILIPPFQRRFVWTTRKAHRFIESLLLGLPVPGLFFYRELETEQYTVIDGQQRLRSLKAFYDGTLRGQPFALQEVHKRFEGKTYNTLDAIDKRRLDNTVLPVTIVRQLKPSKDESSIYHIFERINTGSVSLTPQEIRAAIYRGRFDDLLRELNKNLLWRRIYGKHSPRLKDIELILRFLAFYFEHEAYERPLKGFLNTFMASNRQLTTYTIKRIRDVFEPTVKTAIKALGDRPFRPVSALNAAVLDSVMCGIAWRLESGPIKNTVMLQTAYDRLVVNRKFYAAYISNSSDDAQVKTRLALARKAFATVE